MLLTGLGLAYALPMVSLLSSMLTASAKVEQDMVSVERILQFINIPPARAGGVFDEPGCSALPPLAGMHVLCDIRYRRAYPAAPLLSAALELEVWIIPLLSSQDCVIYIATAICGASGVRSACSNIHILEVAEFSVPVLLHDILLVSKAIKLCTGADEAQCNQGDTTLAFRDVSLTYPGRRVPALDHVSFVLPAGKHVGICGRTGAGKSSLLNALFQLSTIQEGSIRIGRLDITELPARCAPALPSAGLYKYVSRRSWSFKRGSA